MFSDNYYFACGHLSNAYGRPEPSISCALPGISDIVVGLCINCLDGKSTPLAPRARKLKEAAFKEAKANGVRYLHDLNERNKSLETELCSVAPGSLCVSQVRLLRLCRSYEEYHGPVIPDSGDGFQANELMTSILSLMKVV